MATQLQEYWGTGYFNEDSERAPPNLLRAIENKKLLSTAGKLKLLSSADKAGFNLAKVRFLCRRSAWKCHVRKALVHCRQPDTAQRCR